MKGLLGIFSWVSSGIIEGLCPGSLLIDNVLDRLHSYNENALKIAESMQKSWRESVATLQVALGYGSWKTPKRRKQFGEKFSREIITPFALQHNLTGQRLEIYLKKALEQSQKLEKICDDVINFTAYDEKELLAGLSDVKGPRFSSNEIGGMLIEQIQDRLPDAKELLELLWYRNLLLEGLVAHFNLELSRSSGLADLVSRMDRQRIQNDLVQVKTQLDGALKTNDYSQVGILGSKASQLAAAEEVYRLDANYHDLLGPVMEKLDGLSEDHVQMNEKLDQILSGLSKLQDIQQSYAANATKLYKLPLRHTNVSELQLADELTHLVKNVGWNSLSEGNRNKTAKSLAASFFCSNKVSQTLSVLEEVIREGSGDAHIYFLYFEALQAVERYEEAVAAYKKAIELSPNIALFSPESYEMLEILGRGGLATVYKVYDKKAQSEKAVKVLLVCSQWQDKKAKFLQAARAAMEISHPNVVSVYGIEQAETDHPCVVMEYIEGLDLQKKITHDGPFSIDDAIKIAHEIAKGLSFAHQMGLLHRDLKPSNIIYTKEGKIKIIDFGIDKWQRDSTLSITNNSYYTLYYSAPEQLSDDNSLDIRSDIYSFGKVLYYIIMGEEPYDIYWDEVPEAIRGILRRATRKDPNKRYDSLAEMVAELEKAGSGENVELNEEMMIDSGYYPIIQIQKTTDSPIPQEIVERLAPEYELQDNGNLLCKKDQSLMAYVPPGTFVMGDDSDIAEIEEGPLREVYLDGFLIDVYPVTNERYGKFLRAVESVLEEEGKCAWHHELMPQKDKVHIPKFWYNIEWNKSDCPVVGIDWWDAYAYCQWAGKTLPSEAQWEKAARGTDARYYPWGNEAPTPEHCNFDNIVGYTTSVYRYPNNISPYQVYDMVGNVWEWCNDWYDPNYYSKSPKKNPTGPDDGKCRVGRGGSWQKGNNRVRVTTRGYSAFGPGDRSNQIGFRTVKPILAPF